MRKEQDKPIQAIALQQDKKKHDYAFDLLRIIACILVIVNHTIQDVLVGNQFGISEIVASGLYCLCKIAVPIFFMISGALLLRREYTYKEVIIKTLRLFVVLFLFSLFYYMVPIGHGWDLSHFIEKFANGSIIVPYWYLYTLIGIYLMLPFLQKMIARMEKKDFIYFLSLSLLVVSVFPELGANNPIANLVKGFRIPIVSLAVGFMVAGYYISNFVDLKSKKNRNMALVIFVLCLGYEIAMNIFYNRRDHTAHFYFDRDSFPTVMMTVCVFYWIKYCYEKVSLPERLLKVLQEIADTTFGIYLVHMIAKWSIGDWYDVVLDHMNRLVAIGILIGVILIESFLIVRVLFCIPGGRDMLHAPKKKRKAKQKMD